MGSCVNVKVVTYVLSLVDLKYSTRADAIRKSTELHRDC